MSNYLVAKYVGLPFAAIPVFLHRRFRHGFVFVNAAKEITKPTDLIGSRKGDCIKFRPQLFVSAGALGFIAAVFVQRQTSDQTRQTLTIVPRQHNRFDRLRQVRFRYL
jgi:hypothetical protein